MASSEPSLSVDGISLSVKATLAQLQSFFHVKDRLKAKLEHVRDAHSIKLWEIIDIASEIYVTHGMDCQDTFDDPIGVEESIDNLLHVKFHMQVSPDRLSTLESRMSTISQRLKSQMIGEDVGTFCVLQRIVHFTLKNFHLVEAGGTGLRIIINRDCEVCGIDDQVVEFCGANVCLVCKSFFLLHMKRHSLLTLRCHHEAIKQPSIDDHKNLDWRTVACRKCRLDRCAKRGMIDEYHCTILRPISNECLVCSSQDNVVLTCSLSLCAACRTFFDRTCEAYAQQGIRENASRIYQCVSEKKCAVRKSANREPNVEVCPSCVWSRMEKLGLIDVYIIKTQGQRHVRLSDTSVRCCVCQSKSSDELWMGQHVCDLCRSFLKMSMNSQGYQYYCCPDGETEHLCTISTFEEHRCKYCWLRRMELEGLVDRWMICDGDPLLWCSMTGQNLGVKLLSSDDDDDDYDLDDDGDDDDDEDDDDGDDDDDQVEEEEEEEEYGDGKGKGKAEAKAKTTASIDSNENMGSSDKTSADCSGDDASSSSSHHPVEPASTSAPPSTTSDWRTEDGIADAPVEVGEELRGDAGEEGPVSKRSRPAAAEGNQH